MKTKRLSQFIHFKAPKRDLKNLSISEERLVNLTKISDEQKAECEKPFNSDAFSKALSSVKNGKCPVCVGYTDEFYKAFWQQIGPILTHTLNYARDRRTLPLSQRQAVVTYSRI